MSHLVRIQPECLRDVVDYLGTETFMIHEDSQGQYVRISQNRWQWMQGLLAEAMFGKQPREGDDAATEPDYDEVEGGMRWVEEHTSVDPRSGENVTTPARWAFVDRTKGGDA